MQERSFDKYYVTFLQSCWNICIWVWVWVWKVQESALFWQKMLFPLLCQITRECFFFCSVELSCRMSMPHSHILNAYRHTTIPGHCMSLHLWSAILSWKWWYTQIYTRKLAQVQSAIIQRVNGIQQAGIHVYHKFAPCCEINGRCQPLLQYHWRLYWSIILASNPSSKTRSCCAEKVAANQLNTLFLCCR